MSAFTLQLLRLHEHGLAPIQADLIYRRLQVLKQDLESLRIPLLYEEVGTYIKSAERVAEMLLCSVRIEC
ncbi:hypothetical protein N779_20955 [Vibrio coralliilyticus OCN008]|nr:hypothetical protein N779_20955 [Vibrio coralliilyticus OCN008]